MNVCIFLNKNGNVKSRKYVIYANHMNVKKNTNFYCAKSQIGCQVF